ncbi:hypothetical protein ACFXDJ_03900 [Streptomyces sp. NPDC059443]|uniref:hypothetical protein n=1 Tax=unclassified Streptomyces TaxID=2593676 RepID=UPI0036BFD009
MDDKAFRQRLDELKAVVAECLPYFLKVKQTAEFRQDSHYLSPARERIYEPIRSHNEGLNGRLKGAELNIGEPLHCRAPGAGRRRGHVRGRCGHPGL